MTTNKLQEPDRNEMFPSSYNTGNTLSVYNNGIQRFQDILENKQGTEEYPIYNISTHKIKKRDYNMPNNALKNILPKKTLNTLTEKKLEELLFSDVEKAGPISIVYDDGSLEYLEGINPKTKTYFCQLIIPKAKLTVKYQSPIKDAKILEFIEKYNHIVDNFVSN
jgi:hypothetical protein